MIKTEWVICPICRSKTRIKIRPDTIATQGTVPCVPPVFQIMLQLQYVLVQVLPKVRFWEMISFELHLEKWHEKTQKPLWLLGFLRRYLNRFALLVAEEGLEPNTTQKQAALLVVYSVQKFVQCPLQHQKIHRRLTLLTIFCVTAAANLLPSSPTGRGRSRNKLFALRAHNPEGTTVHIIHSKQEETCNPKWDCRFLWLRRKDLNQRPSGYEPDELPTALLRDIFSFI